MRVPMIEVPLRVEFRRVVKAANGHPGKTHVLVNDVTICEVAEFTGWQGSFNDPEGTERVPASEFAGTKACTLCYALVSGISVEDAKQSLAEHEAKQGQGGTSAAKHALWVNPGEIWWDSGQSRSIHYILRGPGGWERHKIATDVDGRKHHDPRLFQALSAYLASKP
jgi:hypothetical protein